MSLRRQMEEWSRARPIQYGAIANSPGQTEGMGYPGGPFRTGGVGDSRGGGPPSFSPYSSGPSSFGPSIGGSPGGRGPHFGGWGLPSPGVHTPGGTVTGSVFADAMLNSSAEGNRQCAKGDWKCLAEANSPNRIA